MPIRNYLIFPFCILFVLSLNAQNAVEKLVQLVGEQDILTQQIVRFYMASDLSVEAGTNDLLFTEHLQKYARNINTIQKLEFPATTAVSKEKVIKAYDKFNRVLAEAPQGAAVFNLLEISKFVLLKSDSLLFALEAHAENKEQINMFALNQLSMMLRKAALSQHSVLYYLARWHNVNNDRLFVDLNHTVLVCERIFRQLTENSVGFPQIEESLINKAYQWAIAEPILTALNEKLRRRDLKTILRAADILYEEGMSIAGSYMKMVKANAASND